MMHDARSMIHVQLGNIIVEYLHLVSCIMYPNK